MGKRNKSYYKSSSKRFKGSELQQGAVGFIFSFARGRDRQAKSEAYELLNSYVGDVDRDGVNHEVCVLLK